MWLSLLLYAKQETKNKNKTPRVGALYAGSSYGKH